MELAAAEVATLGDGGFVKRDGTLGAEAAAHAHAAASALVDAGALRPARIRRGAGARVDPRVRSDELVWLLPEEAPAGLAPVWDAFGRLGEELRREAYLGIGRMDVQLARYAPGAAYARHRDAFAGERASRVATAIYYLNPGWTEADGGLLRLHLPGGAVDVEPLLDRLILFLSPLVEHEVLPARAPRLAVTAWYHGRDPLP